MLKIQSSTEDRRDESSVPVLVPEYKKGYSLLYGSIHFYIVFKMFATIYERIVKAK